MSMKSFYVRNMLLSYDKQLVTARRLARYHRSVSRVDAHEAISVSREAKRRQLVERVAREVIENLLMAGSENDIVTGIREQLEEEFQAKLVFEYPLMEQDLQIMRETPSGPIEVEPQEKMQILNRLWKLTLDKVDETML